MPRVYDLFVAGCPVMYSLLSLSIATLAFAFERGWLWFQLTSQEDRVVYDVLEVAGQDLGKAIQIAQQAQNLAIGRFLLAPLKLNQPSPETFHLAIEAAADKEFDA